MDDLPLAHAWGGAAIDPFINLSRVPRHGAIGACTAKPEGEHRDIAVKLNTRMNEFEVIEFHLPSHSIVKRCELSDPIDTILDEGIEVGHAGSRDLKKTVGVAMSPTHQGRAFHLDQVSLNGSGGHAGNRGRSHYGVSRHMFKFKIIHSDLETSILSFNNDVVGYSGRGVGQSGGCRQEKRGPMKRPGGAVAIKVASTIGSIHESTVGGAGW